MQADKTTEKTASTRNQPSRFIVSLIWGVLVFILLAAAFEGFCRTSLGNKLIPLRSVGDYHPQFEIKWFKLEDYVRQNGGVDVILLGNSMVNTGIDPDLLASRYQELTGQRLRIFNFGVEGLTVAPLSKVAAILEAKYHPGTILLITDIRDYSALNGVDSEKQFLDNAWIQYQLGTNSFSARLIDSSAALQHLLPYRNWSSTGFIDYLISSMTRIKGTSASGYEEEIHHAWNIDANPDPNDPVEKEIYQMFANYSMDQERIDTLMHIINLKDQGTKVFVTGFPVFPTYYAYFSKESQAAFNTAIPAIVDQAGGTYLPVIDYNSIPFEGRADNHHLNNIGAPVYSILLAEQLADQCTHKNNCLLAAPAGGALP